MIVPMKKVSVIVQSKDATLTVESLRKLGVLHVVNENPPKGKDVDTLKKDIAFINKAVQILSLPEFSKKKTPKKEVENWELAARHIIDSWKRLDQLEEYLRTLKNIVSDWQVWGDFDPETIKKFKKKNIHVRLYQIPAKEIKKLPQDIIIKKLFTKGGNTGCAIISIGEPEIPFEELDLPKMSIEKARARINKDAEVMKSIKDDIRKHTCYLEDLVSIRKPLQEELKFHEALSGMGESKSLRYIRGYIPYDSVKTLEEEAKKGKWAISISDPSDDDDIPTLVRNPKWVSIIEPIFKLMEVVPGYRELDASLWFLIFFSIFFGMLIGDAGYGLIFFALTIFAQMKWEKRLQGKSVFILFYILSCAAIVWGVLTGTFFGQEWLCQRVEPLIPALRDNKNIQALCFFLGAFHLSIAHMWRAIIKLPSPKALAQVGWIIILWGAFFLAKMLVLGDAFPIFGKWFFVAGPLLVVFFTNPRKNILKGIGSGFGDLLLNLVNSFTDIVSYIRLFAVGLATVAVADAFNKMAMDIGYSTLMTGVATSLILLLGHTLNIILGSMSILVHGIRLNVLEFCSHLDINWSGFSYKPLQGNETTKPPHQLGL